VLSISLLIQDEHECEQVLPIEDIPRRRTNAPAACGGNLYHQTLLDSRGLVKASTTTVPSLPFYPIANGRWPVTNGHWLNEYFWIAQNMR